jgi:hypothetical protein
VLIVLFSFNCPTFLFSQRQWKLFIENSERKAVLTLPYNDDSGFTLHVDCSLVQVMGTTFLYAISICVLSSRGTSEETFQVKQTPKKSITKAQYFDTPGKPRRNSPRLQKLSGLESEKNLPSFFAGYVDGEPV